MLLLLLQVSIPVRRRLIVVQGNAARLHVTVTSTRSTCTSRSLPRAAHHWHTNVTVTSTRSTSLAHKRHGHFNAQHITGTQTLSQMQVQQGCEGFSG